MNNKQQIFVESYLKCWNATEAARRAGYAHPDVQGPRLLGNVGIAQLIKQRIEEEAMSANEVLSILASHARGDMGDFLEIDSMAFQLDLTKAKELGLTHLIKKVRQKTVTHVGRDGDEEETNTIEIELYDAQTAATTLGKHLRLFDENVNLQNSGELTIRYVNDWRNPTAAAAPRTTSDNRTS